MFDQYECFSFMDLMWKMVIIDWVEEEKVARMVTIAWALWLIEMRSESGVRGRLARMW